MAFERLRLAAASKEIEELSKNIAKGKDKDLKTFDDITSTAEKVIDKKYAMLPIDITANTVFEDAYKYHFEKAQAKLRENDAAGAAAEIKSRRGILETQGRTNRP